MSKNAPCVHCVQIVPQRMLFELVTNQKFDIFIMIVILLNMMTMAIEHYDQPQKLEDVLFIINQIFITIFTLECAMKIIALRHHYFREPWNIFDFVVVISSILGKKPGFRLTPGSPARGLTPVEKSQPWL